MILKGKKNDKNHKNDKFHEIQGFDNHRKYASRSKLLESKWISFLEIINPYITTAKNLVAALWPPFLSIVGVSGPGIPSRFFALLLNTLINTVT